MGGGAQHTQQSRTPNPSAHDRKQPNGTRTGTAHARGRVGLVHATARPWLGRQPGLSFGRVHNAGSLKKGQGGLNARGVALPPLCDDGSGKRGKGSLSVSSLLTGSPGGLGALPCPGR